MHLQLPKSRVPGDGRKRQGLGNTDVATAAKCAVFWRNRNRCFSGPPGTVMKLFVVFCWCCSGGFEIPIQHQQKTSCSLFSGRHMLFPGESSQWLIESVGRQSAMCAQPFGANCLET